MTMPRVVSAETLDRLATDDPAARRSRRDLMRVHRAMRTRSIVSRGLQALVGTRPSIAPLKVLEIGAGDGTFLLGVARSLAPDWPQVQLTLLDRQDVISPATLASYAELGWQARVEIVDVLDWAEQAVSPTPSAADAPRPARWDLITATLFLHHFQRAQLVALLGTIASRADRFFACEPHRSSLALAGSHLVGAIGANSVTRADAVLSVRAGFRPGELTTLWPDPGTAWRCGEYAAGLFSHCFSARRIGTT